MAMGIVQSQVLKSPNQQVQLPGPVTPLGRVRAGRVEERGKDSKKIDVRVNTSIGCLLRESQPRPEPGRSLQPSPGPEVDKREEEEEEDGMGPCPPVTPKNCLAPRGISVLEKLVKTCPVWLQLGLGRAEAARILHREAAGTFLVRRDSCSKHLVLCVHFPSLNGSSSEVLEYTIKEEKSILYLEGSVLVFEDIFRLIAFYCVSRDLLPFTLRLPQAILEASSFTDLKTIANLGLGKSAPRAGEVPFSSSPGDLRGWAGSVHPRVPSIPGSCPSPAILCVGVMYLVTVNLIMTERKGEGERVRNIDERETLISCLLHTSYRGCARNRGHPHFPVTTNLACIPRLRVPLSPLAKLARMSVSQQPPCPEMAPCSPGRGFRPADPPRTPAPSRTSPESNWFIDQHLHRRPGVRIRERIRVEPVALTARTQGGSALYADRDRLNVETDQTCRFAVSAPRAPPPPASGKKGAPAAPPRRRLSEKQGQEVVAQASQLGILPESARKIRQPPKDNTLPPKLGPRAQKPRPAPRRQSAPEFKGSLASLSDSTGVHTPATDQDSYSTSSTEEELEQFSSPCVKKKPSMILGKARHRLSLASFTSVFQAFLSSDRKLYKKVVELAQDKASYFGNLVQDYKVYSLEMMARQASSTEMLQEIRTMMTQLKSYLLQSTELKALGDHTQYSEEELEAIVESALYKCVLKPLKEAINSCLHEIHSKDGSLQQLKENQLVILATTTTDLGVTTSVPEVPVMEKILQKFSSMHKAYSPEKKIAILLKTCKLIYDSMALGNPGKPYGADDFLPVLMYVLARSNLTEMLLNVEYMMELMDPALQLGEGSYYLTTTYGALEHIKNYDKITVTRQLSVEVQDSIHRWERRRTLNKARASRSSVQDFICVSYLEPEQQSRTLASRADTLATALCAQCAEKFEVLQPQDHRLFVLVDGRCFQLADEALPHHIKGYLLRSEPKRDFHFVYRPLDGGGSGDPPCLVVREPNFL
ncbi:hypothetical protein QTO34_020121 [Cnephaeus nilssonii]|uniref:Ras and Rab interactor 3 n=1 Tax=Cnephaeus nilssonii TaxID=3371016 RepID=A0AA40HXW7_CNENI|nr:hypothetical protein QTO34_020121 [Eptesicus nilssonii]